MPLLLHDPNDPDALPEPADPQDPEGVKNDRVPDPGQDEAAVPEADSQEG